MNKRQKLVQQQFLNNEKAVIGRLKSVYGKSLEDVNEKVKNLTFAINNLQQEYDWLDDTDPKKAKIKSQIQSKIYQKQYQEQLQKQIDGIFTKMKTNQYTTVSSYLDDCYENGFIGSLFDAHGQGVPITTPINQKAMVQAVQLDSKISKGLYTRLGEDVDLLKKKITAQVSRSIATGMDYRQTAQALSNYSRIGFNNAVRITRTEGHRIQCQSTMDAMESAKDRGADILKQWDATLDGHTRESHAMVDMEIRELDKPFSNGLMFPGDPSGKAAEVINCRCSIDQRAKWEFEDDDQSFTKFNNFTGQLETFESPQTYDEFKKAFFSPENKTYMNYVGDLEEKYGTRDFKKLLANMSEREYEHYSKLLQNNPVYNKKSVKPKAVETPKRPVFVPATTIEEADKWLEVHGIRSEYAKDKVNLEVANVINRTIGEFKDIFGDTMYLKGVSKYSKRGAEFVAAYNPWYGTLLLNRVSSKTALKQIAKDTVKQFSYGAWSTGDVEHFIRHELGHALHTGVGESKVESAMTTLFQEATAGLEWGKYGYSLESYKSKGLSVDKFKSDLVEAGRILSAYGFTSTNEMVAESVAEYMTGHPREFATKVVHTLMGWK